jgi:hypothetical protein
MRKRENSYVIRESKVSKSAFNVELSTISTGFSFKLGGTENFRRSFIRRFIHDAIAEGRKARIAWSEDTLFPT